MELFYFGRSRQLLGARSEARGAVRRTGILICPSLAMEYFRTYRGLHLLAEQLAGRGFETLRFDYSCTGDSAGSAHDARVEDWVEDAGTAARELRDLTGCSRVCVLGLRAGALIATRALAGGTLKADHFLAWDAPADGQQWLDQMRALDIALYDKKNRYRTPASAIPPAPAEVLGMPLSEGLLQALGGLPAPAAQPGVGRIDARSSDEAPAAGPDALGLPDEAHWTDVAWITTPWAPPRSFAALVSRLEATLP